MEIGAHQGYMMADIIQFIYTLQPNLIKSLRFVIIEPLESARKAQESYFVAAFGDALHVEILPSLEGFTCKDAIVVSNELLDAFACEVIHDGQMLYMDAHEPKFGSMDEGLKAKALELGVTQGEISLGYEELGRDLANACEKCRFVSFDYGQEYPRNDFSLRVYQNHETYPFFTLTCKAGESERLGEFYGKCDLTYDVNFDHVRKAFMQSGFKNVRIISQMQALVEFGIHELLALLQTKVDEKTYRNEAEKAKQLIVPGFFGERFKMIECVKEK
jgi:SAM-dependent MidA family methyltransferase